MAGLASGPKGDAIRFASVIADILERLKRLERTGQLAHSSIDGGALSAYDDDGTLRMLLGLQADGTYASTDHNGPVPPTPTKPLVTALAGGMRVTWDGGWVVAFDAEWGTVVSAPLDFRQIDVVISTDPLADFVNLPASATFHSTFGGMTAVLTGFKQVTYYVALVARSQSQVSSPRSELGEVIPISAPKFKHVEVLDVVSAKVAHTKKLAYVPIVESLHVDWNGLALGADTFTYPEPRSVRVADAALFVRPGDQLRYSYAYMPDDQPETRDFQTLALLANPTWYFDLTTMTVGSPVLVDLKGGDQNTALPDAAMYNGEYVEFTGYQTNVGGDLGNANDEEGFTVLATIGGNLTSVEGDMGAIICAPWVFGYMWLFRFGVTEDGRPSFVFPAMGVTVEGPDSLANDGLQHLIVGTWDAATRAVKLYHGSELIAEATIPGAIGSSIQFGGFLDPAMYIGGSPVFSNRYFVGDVYNAAYYAHVLTPDDWTD